MHEADALQAALAALWADAQPRLAARVESMATETDRAQALADAHTLVGTLGSFGVADGSAAAREAERALESGDRAAFRAAVERLRAAISTTAAQTPARSDPP